MSGRSGGAPSASALVRRLMGHLPSGRLRLIDAVTVAAIAMLALKSAELALGPPKTPEAAGSDGLPAFGRVIAHARTNYEPPDVAMTGAVTKDVPPKEGAPAKDPKDVKGAPAAAKAKQPPAPGTDLPSTSERALLERLGERRDELQQKDRELDMRERLLENAERKIDTRFNELKRLESKTEAAAKRGDDPATALKNLVTMYETMKPKDAARVFDRLPHDVLVPVVLQMNPRKMAEVLAVMSPEAAEKLTIALATRARGEEPRIPTASAGLPPHELPAIVDPTGPQR